MIQEKIIIAGAGGQGIMLLGKVIAHAAMRRGLAVTWLPAYGAEVRGGTAHCMVVIAGAPIGSPYIERADTLIVMNAPSMTRFHSRLKKNGLLIVNSSLVQKYPAFTTSAAAYPFTERAAQLGNPRIANMIALGVYIAGSRIIDQAAALSAIAQIAPVHKQGLIAINQQAVRQGVRMALEKGKL